MRHIVLFVSVLPAATIHAQDYLGNEPVWLQRSVCAVPAPCIATDTYNYYTAGDSVIQGVTWTKVVREGQVTYSWQAPPPVGPDCSGTVVHGPEYHGVRLIRQEGRQLRVWVDDADQLLHEFDLQVGQVLPLSHTNWNEDITVVAVDHVQVGTEMRARYELGNSWAQYLIEGVGSSHGLFEPLSNFLECGHQLDCFGLGAGSYYPEGWEGSCWVAMGVADRVRSVGFSVMPNPAEGDVVVMGATSGELVQLNDVLGRRVLSTRALSDRVQLDVSALPEGCYTVTSEGRSSRLQVVH